MKFTITPTFRCLHKCEYCNINHSLVEASELPSIDEMCLRIEKIVKILYEQYNCKEFEFLLSDHPYNLDDKIKQTIEKCSKIYFNSRVTVLMNNVNYSIKNISISKHFLNPNDFNFDGGVFVVNESNISLLTDEIIQKYKNSIIFILDMHLNNAVKRKINDVLKKRGAKFIIFETFYCIKNGEKHYDISLDSGLITESCSGGITHISGQVDFDNMCLIFNNIECNKNCYLN